MTSTPDRVDRVLHHRRERPRQLRLAHVVLVLPDADRLGVDLDQFRQGILEAPGDRRGAAMGYVGRATPWRRSRRPSRSRRRPRRPRPSPAARSGFAAMISAARRSVSRDAVPLPTARSSTPCSRQSRPSVGLPPAPLRLVRVGRLHRDDPPGPIRHRDLHAVPVARIEPHRRPPARRAPGWSSRDPGKKLAGLVAARSNSRPRRSCLIPARIFVRRAVRTVSRSQASPGRPRAAISGRRILVSRAREGPAPTSSPPRRSRRRFLFRSP